MTNLSVIHIIQSHIIRKLNPMKRPSTPPQSATRDWKENASSSLRTCTDRLTYRRCKAWFLFGLIIGSSFIYKNIYHIYILYILLTLYSMNVHGIIHFVVLRISSLSMQEVLSYIQVYSSSCDQFWQLGKPSIGNRLRGGWQPILIAILVLTH